MIRRECLNPFSRRPLTSLRPSRTRRRRSTEAEARPYPTEPDAVSDAATEANQSPAEGASGTNRMNGDCDLPSPPTNTGVGRRAAAIFRLLAPRGDPRGELPSSCPLRTRDARSDASHPPDSRTRRRGGPGPTSVDHARGVAHAVGASTARIPPAQKNPSTRRGFGCTNAFVEAAPTRRATDSRCKTRQLTPLFPRPPPLLVTKTDARSTMNPNNGVPPPRVPPPHQPHGGGDDKAPQFTFGTFSPEGVRRIPSSRAFRVSRGSHACRPRSRGAPHPVGASHASRSDRAPHQISRPLAPFAS